MAPTRFTPHSSLQLARTQKPRLRRACWFGHALSRSTGGVVSGDAGAPPPPGGGVVVPPPPGGGAGHGENASPSMRYTGPLSDVAYTCPHESSPNELRPSTVRPVALSSVAAGGGPQRRGVGGVWAETD